MNPQNLSDLFYALPILPPYRRLPAHQVDDPMSLLEDFYAADLHTYPQNYQVEYDKLKAALESYPEGFTLLQVQTSQGWLPAGYTALHFIDPGPPRLPLSPTAATEKSWLYIFNYSAHPRFHHSPLTRDLLKSLATQLENLPFPRVAATVSPDGERIARRLGLRPIQTLVWEGHPWLWWESGQSDRGAL